MCNMGGIALHEAEYLRCEQGRKTLVATLPLYLNCLSGEAFIGVTVNDYLAKWGAEWMGPLYSQLGVTVGVVYSGQDIKEKRDAIRPILRMELTTRLVSTISVTTWLSLK